MTTNFRTWRRGFGRDIGVTNTTDSQGLKYLILAAAATLYARLRVRNGDGSKFGPMTYIVGAHGGRSGHLVLFLVALLFSKLQTFLNTINILLKCTF